MRSALLGRDPDFQDAAEAAGQALGAIGICIRGGNGPADAHIRRLPWFTITGCMHADSMARDGAASLRYRM